MNFSFHASLLAGKTARPSGYGHWVIRYADVLGQDQAVEAVRDMVELPLTHADRFARVGVRDAGGGIILAGAPGTSKTLLARAVAGESKAHLEIVAGPELLSK
jgi:transitional endoplasmic reticulum ATPase